MSQPRQYKINSKTLQKRPMDHYKEKPSSFIELLEKGSSVFIDVRNVKMLATEIYKTESSFSLCHVFAKFSQPSVESESLSFSGPKVLLIHD